MDIKKLYHLVVLVCFLILAFLVLRGPDAPAPVEFRGVMRAVDGDTLAAGGERLRLKGIDAPELHQTCDLGGTIWHCGLSARDQLQRLAAGRDLLCRVGGRDKYRRLLATCVAGGIEINREMVLTGLAVDYGGYRSEAEEAKLERRGLWAGRFERPEAWRGRRAAVEPVPDALIDDFWSSLRDVFGVH